MTKLLVCIDGSIYADTVCTYAAAFSRSLAAEIDLLHVLRRQSSYQATADLSGSIGLGARSALREKLLSVDEARGKLDQQKGKLILSHCQEILSATGVSTTGVLHRRGPLVETIQELETGYDMIFVGKRGEHAQTDSRYLGSNLEKVARGVHKPLFVAALEYRPIQRLLIAFDGKASTLKAVDFFVSHSNLSHLECHLLSIGKIDNGLFETAASRLRETGYSVTGRNEAAGSVEKQITDYVKKERIDWLAIGAYSHSPLRNLLLGSTSASLILSSQIPMVLFR